MNDKDEKPSESTLPEAPASVNTRLKSPNGFIYQWTIRDEKNSNLLYKIREMEKKWLELGFTPVEQSQGFASKFPPKVKKECPIHKGVMMTEKVSKKDNSKYFSHSRGVYPNFGEWCNGAGYPSELSQDTAPGENYY